MRFALVAVAAVSLAAVTGCGSTPAPVSDGAWVVNFDPGTPPAGATPCAHGANFTEMLGQVTDTILEASITDGETVTADDNQTGHVSCSVTGSGTFNASVNLHTTDKTLTLDIPSITTAATLANPAKGTAFFESAQYTADNAYSGTDCDFYFKKSPESVASGKIWAAFTCAAVVNSGGGVADTCAISESYFVFENCGM